MNKSAATSIVRTWRVGHRTCTMTVPRFKPGDVVNVVVEWAPNEPSRLSTAEWAEYRAGRNHAITGIGAELGVKMRVIG